MNELIKGYTRFRQEVWPQQRERYEGLAATGQSPETLVIACSDSRVDPQTIFGGNPGELFVVRNIAALVPPYQPDATYHGTSAAIEFAVRVLKVKRIVVLGHAQCGGVRAVVDGAPREASDFLTQWTAIADDILRLTPKSHDHSNYTHYETEVVLLSLSNLRTFPWIASAEEKGMLSLHGFYFGIATGVLSEWRDGAFFPVV